MKVTKEQLQEMVRSVMLKEQVEILGNKVLEMTETSTQDLVDVISNVLGFEDHPVKEKEIKILLRHAIVRVVAAAEERNRERQNLERQKQLSEDNEEPGK